MLRRLYHWLRSLFKRNRKETVPDEVPLPSSLQTLTDWLEMQRKERKLRMRRPAGCRRRIIEVADFPEALLLFIHLPVVGTIKAEESAGVNRYTCELSGGAVLSLDDKVSTGSNELAKMCLHEPRQRKAALKILFVRKKKKNRWKI
jgi:hypothetical protein